MPAFVDFDSLFDSVDVFPRCLCVFSGAIGSKTSGYNDLEGMGLDQYPMWIDNGLGCGPVESFLEIHHADILYHGQVVHADFCPLLGMAFQN